MQTAFNCACKSPFPGFLPVQWQVRVRRPARGTVKIPIDSYWFHVSQIPHVPHPTWAKYRSNMMAALSTAVSVRTNSPKCWLLENPFVPMPSNRIRFAFRHVPLPNSLTFLRPALGETHLNHPGQV